MNWKQNLDDRSFIATKTIINFTEIQTFTNSCLVFLVQFVTSIKGKPQIKIGPYKFYKCKIIARSGKTRWECSSGRGCKAVVYTIDDIVITMRNVHNH